VIGHPTPAEQLDRAGLELVAKQILVAAPVFVGQEDVLAIVAAVGDVMRYADRHQPRLAGHQSGGNSTKFRPEDARNRALSPFLFSLFFFLLARIVPPRCTAIRAAALCAGPGSLRN
jgi:hypothetical protein